MIKFSDVFLESMTPMIGSLYFVSVIIFLIVMYLMMKVIVDRADFPIALFRTFGYQNNEIRRLFLDGNFIAIAVMSVVIVPLCKYLMDKMWPSLVSYVPMGLDVKFRPYYYFIIVGLILASYLLINFILMQKLKKNEEDIVSILKERE
jgi:putative ABC transport system permease protein